jgi:hypothetical protein
MPLWEHLHTAIRQEQGGHSFTIPLATYILRQHLLYRSSVAHNHSRMHCFELAVKGVDYSFRKIGAECFSCS